MPHPLRFLFAAAALLAFALPSRAQTVVSDPSALTWVKTRNADTITPDTVNHSVLFTEGQTSGSSFVTNFTATSVAVDQTLSALALLLATRALRSAKNKTHC